MKDSSAQKLKTHNWEVANILGIVALSVVYWVALNVVLCDGPTVVRDERVPVIVEVLVRWILSGEHQQRLWLHYVVILLLNGAIVSYFVYFLRCKFYHAFVVSILILTFLSGASTFLVGWYQIFPLVFSLDTIVEFAEKIAILYIVPSSICYVIIQVVLRRCVKKTLLD